MYFPPMLLSVIEAISPAVQHAVIQTFSCLLHQQPFEQTWCVIYPAHKKHIHRLHICSLSVVGCNGLLVHNASTKSQVILQGRGKMRHLQRAQGALYVKKGTRFKKACLLVVSGQGSEAKGFWFFLF